MKDGIPWEAIQRMSDNEVITYQIISMEISKVQEELLSVM